MSGDSKGHMGAILRVNLTTGSVAREKLSSELITQFIGGRGIGAKILYDELPPGTEPLSPENKLVFTTGPLAGTAAQSCCRWMITTKAPLTGGMFRSTAGGGFGAEVKASGYDVLIVEGKAERPVYLWIHDDQVEIRDAGHLAGKLSSETTDALRSDLGDKIKLACIGPAGEKLVRFAAIIDERRRTASRGGVGAVMGAKNLKAIAARGSHTVTAADAKALMALTKKQSETLQSSPQFGAFMHLGTASAVGFCHELGVYPVKNYQQGVFAEVNGNLTGDKVEEVFVKDAFCHRCHIHCGVILKTPDGPRAGDEVEGPEYETLYSFGGEIGNAELGLVIEANRICDDYGVDTMSAGCTIGFAMELYEKGIMSRDELDGLDLTWGNREATLALLNKIVLREGIGDLLAEGTRVAAAKIGKGAEHFAMQVKGLELPGYESRGLKASGLNLATAALGASHCVGQTPQEIMGAGAVDRFAADGKAALCKMNQDRVAYFETGILCLFPMALGVVNDSALGEMLCAATGNETLRGLEYLRAVGERIWNIERAFNVREGFGRTDDYLPERFITEALPDGPVKGHTVEMDRLLDDYYAERGWDQATGRPSRETLERLGLRAVADDLERIG